MANNLIRDAILISGIFASGVFAFVNRDAFTNMLVLTRKPFQMPETGAKAKRQRR